MNSMILRIAGILIVAAFPASAGVVVTQEETRGSTTEKRTILVEGSKQKSTGTNHSVIIDLDAATMTTLDPAKKTATEMSMKGAAGGMMQSMISQLSGKFEPTGVSKTIAGFPCKEYKSSGAIMTGEFTSTTCMSTETPGAAEFTAFYRTMMEKISAKIPEGLPKGIMLAHDMTVITKMPAMPSAQGVPPEVAKKMAEAMASTNRGPQTFKTVVTSVKAQTLGPDAFAIPDGYTKQVVDLDAMMGRKPGGQKPPAGR